MKKNIIILGILSLNCAFASVPTILFIGDSHSYGKFGTAIDANLSKVADRVILESSCGSSPSTWLGTTGYAKTVCGFWKKDGKTEMRSVKHSTPKFAEELSLYRPDVTIVELGTNIAANSNPLNAKDNVEKMMSLMAENNTKCIWIGPPDASSKIVTKSKLAITNKMLAELALKHNCEYIDSLKLTTYPTNSSDGIHYGPKMAAEWGEKVSAKVLELIQ